MMGRWYIQAMRDLLSIFGLSLAVAVLLGGCARAPATNAPLGPWTELQYDTTRGFQDTLLDRFVGTWVLEGTMSGGDVVHDVTAEWVTGHQYLQIVELSREREPDGARSYEAIVLIGWDEANARYACLWLDSTSGEGLVNGVIGYAEPAADRLAFVFDWPPDDPDSRFHTTFIRDDDSDTWDWRMDAERDGTFTPFARATMRRGR
jgi:hypothetical protein